MIYRSTNLFHAQLGPPPIEIFHLVSLRNVLTNAHATFPYILNSAGNWQITRQHFHGRFLFFPIIYIFFFKWILWSINWIFRIEFKLYHTFPFCWLNTFFLHWLMSTRQKKIQTTCDPSQSTLNFHLRQISVWQRQRLPKKSNQRFIVRTEKKHWQKCCCHRLTNYF